MVAGRVDGIPVSVSLPPLCQFNFRFFADPAIAGIFSTSDIKHALATQELAKSLAKPATKLSITFRSSLLKLAIPESSELALIMNDLEPAVGAKPYAYSILDVLEKVCCVVGPARLTKKQRREYHLASKLFLSKTFQGNCSKAQ